MNEYLASLDRHTRKQCEWAWHSGATAVLSWVQASTYYDPNQPFPHNPFEVLEDDNEQVSDH